MDQWVKKSFHHGDLPNALRAAGRAIIEEARPDAVDLRATARRVGVSATAVYRHFASKDALLASIAAQGFDELSAAINAPAGGPDPLLRAALAYIEFAARSRGLYRFMFGLILAERTKYPALNEAAWRLFDSLGRAVAAVDKRPFAQNAAAIEAWTSAHGIASLLIEGILSEADARGLAERVLATAAEKRGILRSAEIRSLSEV